MKPIDADALIDRVKNMDCVGVPIEIKKTVDNMLHKLLPKIIDEEPTLDYEPVKYGRWIYNRYTQTFPWKCSECNYDTVARFNFCSNCGARMED